MNYRRLMLIACFCLLPVRAFADARPCDAVEVTDIEYSISGTYNSLVCAAVVHLNEGRYPEAIQNLEQASELRLLDSPNYALFSRLAFAYHLAGNSALAAANLEKARLSLSLLVGLMHCRTSEGRHEIVDRFNVPIRSAFSPLIADLMCGPANELLYADMSLEDIASMSELLEYHLEVKQAIKEPRPK